MLLTNFDFNEHSQNIFSENSDEFFLVQLLITFFNKIKKDEDYLSEYYLNSNLNDKFFYFININLKNKIDLFDKVDFIKKVINLSRQSKVLTPKKLFLKNMVGIYLESSIINLYKSNSYLEELILSNNNSNIEHLLKIAKLHDEFLSKNLYINAIKNNNSIIINNTYDLEKIKNFSYIHPSWVDADNRGIYHHVGDHLALYYSLSQNNINPIFVLEDEFGDVINPFNNFVYRKDDFLLLYSVPRITDSNFNSFIKNIRKNNDDWVGDQINMNNSLLSKQWFKNQTILKNSHRKIVDMNFSLVFECFYKLLKETFAKYSIPFSKKTFVYKEIDYQTIFNINKEIEDKFCFFIKSIEQKKFCFLVNPTSNCKTGFFNKNGFNQKLNLSFLIKTINDTTLKFSLDLNSKPIKEILKEIFLYYFFEYDFPQYLYLYNETINNVIVSQLINMEYEYRIFIYNHKIITSTPCFRATTPFNHYEGGIFDPSLCDGHNASNTFIDANSRRIVAKYAKFAKKLVKELKLNNPEFKHYVLDVALNIDNNGNENVVPIEVNSFNYSGPYQADMRKISCAILNTKLSQANRINIKKLLD